MAEEIKPRSANAEKLKRLREELNELELVEAKRIKLEQNKLDEAARQEWDLHEKAILDEISKNRRRELRLSDDNEDDEHVVTLRLYYSWINETGVMTVDVLGYVTTDDDDEGSTWRALDVLFDAATKALQEDDRLMQAAENSKCVEVFCRSGTIVYDDYQKRL